jgi:hypothetical protein
VFAEGDATGGTETGGVPVAALGLGPDPVFAEGDATGGTQTGDVLVAALGLALASSDGERSPSGPIRTPAVAAEPLMKASSATTISAIVACLLLIPLALSQTTSGELRCGVGG